MTHEEWLKARRKGVSGTDIAAIMGLNPYKSESQLLVEKLGVGVPFTGNAATRAGQRLEPFVANWWAYRNQTIITNGAFTVSSENPRFFGTPDFLTPHAGLEIKTGAEKGYKNGCPVIYSLQSQWYMMITERERWELSALIVPKDRSKIPLEESDEYLYEWVKMQPIREYPFQRDRALEARMKEHATRFLERLDGLAAKRLEGLGLPPA